MSNLLKKVPPNLVALATSEPSKYWFIEEYVSIYDKEADKKRAYLGMIWNLCHKGEITREEAL